MSYADFTLSKLVKQFSLILEETADLYGSVCALDVRLDFETQLVKTASLALKVSTEKARSEFVIAPILVELWLLAGQKFGLHSGVDFPVDPEHGLVGVCDFVITRSPEQFFVKAPIVLLVEAKTEDITRGFGQCVAEMLAAQRFNDREGSPSDKTYGVVTAGAQWKFFELEGSIVRIDAADYYIKDLGKIFGILMHMASA
jgi:hypothetical protein